MTHETITRDTHESCLAELREAMLLALAFLEKSDINSAKEALLLRLPSYGGLNARFRQKETDER